MQRARVISVGVAVAVVLAAAIVFAFGSVDHHVIRLVPDDGFYYFEIARRLANGEGATFDGITRTNGFHPLWTLLLVPMGPIFEASRDLGARAAGLLSLAFMAGAFYGLHVLGGRHARAGWAPLLVASCVLGPASVYGLETGLVLCLLTGMLLAVDRISAVATVFGGVAVGTLLGLTVLARLDAAIYVLVFNVLWLRLALADARLRGALGVAILVQAIIVGAYLAVNVGLYGHLLPISALVKGGRSVGINLLWAKSLLALLGVLSAGLGAAVLAAGLTVRPHVQLAAFGVLAHMGVLAVEGGRESYNWYFAPPVLCGAVLVGPFLGLLHRRIGVTLPNLVVVIGCLGLLGVAVRGKLAATGFAEKIERSRWIAETVPEGAVFAEGDCGLLGYLSHHAFLNVDGLTNGFAFQDAIANDTVGPWLLASGLDAIVLAADERPASVSLRIRRGMTGATVPPVELVIEPWSPAVGDARYRLWRVTGIAD